MITFGKDHLTIHHLGSVTETPHHGTIDPLGQVMVGGIIASTVPIHRDKPHDSPIGNQQAGRRDHLRATARVEEEQGGSEIADRNSLQRIGVEIDPVRIQSQEITLANHTEDPQQSDPFQQAANEGTFVRTTFETGQGEWHGGSRHKEEERHDQVPWREALPLHMVEEPHTVVQPRNIHRPRKRADDGT